MKTTILPTTTTKNRTEPKFKSARGVTGQLLIWASMNRPPWRRGFVLIALTLASFALSPQARAVCQEGCLTNGNTVLGDDALINNTGFFNTATGQQALLFNTTGSNNTATGNLALFSNTEGAANTATGNGALISNTTGSDNTATGVDALSSNIIGSDNTATGFQALGSNTTGSDNTATGQIALVSNTTGSNNTASGVEALFSNTTGDGNTANGRAALQTNTIGDFNTATGHEALFSNRNGSENLAYGSGALFSNTTGNANAAYGGDGLFSNTTGSGNIAVGYNAGSNLTTGDNNIDIGNSGAAGESNTIRIGTQGTQNRTFIAGISGSAVNGSAVKINGSGRLGVAPSSARFKDEIKPMDRTSEAILALKPVTFRYKKELDPQGTPQFGLVAEEVEKVNPDLVARDDHGKPYTVRYEAVNAMLLNEFLKEHRQVQEQEATITQLKSTVAKQEATAAHQQKEIEALTAGLQKVSAQVQMSRSAPQIVLNNQ